MYLLRVGRQSRWRQKSADRPEDVAGASLDLVEREAGEGLSVYRVEDEGEAREAALFFAATCRERPDSLDYVLIPPECFAGFEIAAEPDEALHPYLSSRHHEVKGITAENRAELAKRILGAIPPVHRLAERDLRHEIRARTEESDAFGAHLRQGWRAEIEAARRR